MLPDKAIAERAGFRVISSTLWLREKNGTGINPDVVRTLYDEENLVEITIRCKPDDVGKYLGLLDEKEVVRVPVDLARLTLSSLRNIEAHMTPALSRLERLLLASLSPNDEKSEIHRAGQEGE